ncbi:MAG: TMEM43 family protein [Pararhodobacter sp.]|nr:TMEM43 family protein [Pararhodobacter sp.]
MVSRKITRVSWFDRLKNSVAGVGLGIVLVIGMVGALFWNEGRAVQTQRSLDEGAGLFISVDSGAVDPESEGQLIHVSGPLSTDETVSDAQFSIEAQGIRLLRRVEMYQWVQSSRTETQQNLGGSETRVTTYNYTPDWSERYHDSARFHEPAGHQNPAMIFESTDFSIASADLGAFSLGDNVLRRIGGAQPLPVEVSHAEMVQAVMGERINVSVVDGALYMGANPLTPQIGDYRIRYELVPLGAISVIGQQRGDGIAAYATQAGDSLLFVSRGEVLAPEMFDDAARANTALTWVVRVGGLVLLIAGFSLMLGPLSVAASVVPFLGSMVGLGAGLVAAIAGIALGTLTIGLAWLFYRPLIGVLIFSAGAALIVVIRMLARRRKPAADEKAVAT